MNRACRLATEAAGGFYHPLLPRYGIWLLVYPLVAKELAEMGQGAWRPGERFARGFRATWRRIPLSARRHILGYWRKQEMRIEVELTKYRLESNGLAACCAEFGRVLRFMPYHDLLPSDATASTIAHELAHSYHFATAGLEAMKFHVGEAFAVRTAEEWGFPQSRTHEKKHKWTKNYRAFVKEKLELEELEKRLARR